MPDTFLLEIATPDRLVISEQVEMVTAPGVEGQFGVLPGHTPFLTLLKFGEISYRVDGEDRFMVVSWGFAEVLPHCVSVLVETAEMAQEIDLARAEAAGKRAEERLARKDAEDIDVQRAQAAMARSMIRLQVTRRGDRRSRG
ncbi:MAG: F0F1 ATP synthase subunit epsilon [Deltaproteobacteria bacterium]|nr:F0F1 ATP synthase subunit epsilon [Deltaproteobacteria bacterium]MBW2148361.1 F0F1 ATP synthase subunit epsilon [Deltaproteobacteria bacterium]MBW2307401.1 F0F1 ATP synthase subunit epsilon [Deltaproteobacteria bacterium]